MSDPNIRPAPVSEALRAAGYVPLPRWWVRRADLDQIEKLALSYADEVNGIRQRLRSQNEAPAPGQSAPDPRADKEAAWAAYERARGN